MKTYIDLLNEGTEELSEGRLVSKYKLEKDIKKWAKEKAESLRDEMENDAWSDSLDVWDDVSDDDAELMYEELGAAMWKELYKAMSKVK